MFKKSYFTRSRFRTPDSSEDGTICNNGLRLKGRYYSIVKSNSTLNVSRGLRPALIAMVLCEILSYLRNTPMKNTKLGTKFLTTNAIENCNRKDSNAMHSLILICTSVVCHSYTRMSFGYHLYVTSMSSVCHSCALVWHPYVTPMYSYVTPTYWYVICLSLVCTCMSLVCTRMSFVCHSSVVLP